MLKTIGQLPYFALFLKSPNIEPHQGLIKRSYCGLSAWVSEWTFMCHKSTGDPRLQKWGC